MSPVDLLAELRRRGVRLSVHGDKLRYVAPKGALTPDLLEAMRRHKPDLLRLLSRPPIPPDVVAGVEAALRAGRWVVVGTAYGDIILAPNRRAAEPAAQVVQPRGVVLLGGGVGAHLEVVERTADPEVDGHRRAGHGVDEAQRTRCAARQHQGLARAALLHLHVVRMQGLVKRYPVPGTGRNGASAPRITVLELSHLPVGPRTALVVAGPSGAGKITLLNILAGIVRPSEGRVELLGPDLFALLEGRRNAFRARYVGCVFQTFNLIGSLSALGNVLLAMAVAGCVPKRERGRHALGLLEQVGMHRRLRHRPAQLSVGEQHRMAVARALANRPELVLAGKSTANFDRRNAGAVLRVLRDAVAAAGSTLTMATHDIGASSSRRKRSCTSTPLAERSCSRLRPARHR